MPIDQIVSLISPTISFVGLVFVAVQLRQGTTQRESDSLVKIYDINRQLLSLGFAYPQLFDVLADAKNVDPVLERRYLQLWLNQFTLIHLYQKRSILGGEIKDGLEREIADFMAQDNMQRHWHEHGTFYPESFQKLVNGLIKKNEPPVAAHVKPKRKHHAPKT